MDNFLFFIKQFKGSVNKKLTFPDFENRNWEKLNY